MATRKGNDKNAQIEARWRGVLREWEASGESLRGFCLKRDLCEATVHRWKRRFRLREEESQTKERSSLVPVEIEKIGSMGSGVEVETRTGHRIHVFPGFDKGTFQEVLSALEGKAC